MARNTIWIDNPSVVSAVFTALSGTNPGYRWDDVTDQALEAHSDGNWSDYLVASAQVGTTEEWGITVPAALPGGLYAMRVYDGAAPVVTDSPIGSMEFYWDGTDAYRGMDVMDYLELQAQNGLTIYAVFRNASGQYWNGSTYETFNAANWGNYDVAGTEVASAELYQWTSNIPAGAVIYDVRSQVGGSPATTDPRILGGSLRL